MARSFPVLTVALAGLLLAAPANAKKKKKAEAPPPVGWFQAEGQTRACYYPPKWDQLGETGRRIKRAEVLDAMLSQWKGERDDGVEFKEGVVEDVEITLLGRPADVEVVAGENLEFCQRSALPGGELASWQAWAKGLPPRLTAGECLTPFDYTMFDYLDIFIEWQRTVPVCKGDRVHISATGNDKYRVKKDGPWINAAGDPDVPTAASGDYPCNVEGCYEGMFFVRFVTENGVELILPTGLDYTFEAPENGELSYRINDTQFFDNQWYKKGGVEDHTGIELSPAE